MSERLSLAQQENILTLLCYHDEYGKLAANLVDAALFEGDYREVAVRVIDWWRKYKEAPKLHTPDLFSEILESDDDRRAEGFRQILLNVAHMEKGLNTQYVMQGLQAFVRVQNYKGAIMSAAEIIHRPDATAPDNIERIDKVLRDVVKTRALMFDTGTKLDDDLEPFLDYLQRHHGEFVTGIAPLDDANIAPARGELFLLIAGKGRGKSWWLVNLGKKALMKGKRVLHISLENSEMETKLRYFQTLFSVPRWNLKKIEITEFVWNPDGTMRKPVKDYITPKFTMQSAELRSELEVHLMDVLGYASRNLIIKRFPTRALTIEGLEAYLDSLEQQKFMPDILLVDYPKLMKPPNPKDLRQSLRENTERLRGLAVERNIAVAVVDQLNREGHKSGMATSAHIGEDISQIHTADTVITHSATDAERRSHLARLYVDHARTAKDKFGVLVSQALDIGQFVRDAVELPKNYYDDIQPTKRSADEADVEQAEEEIAVVEAA